MRHVGGLVAFLLLGFALQADAACWNPVAKTSSGSPDKTIHQFEECDDGNNVDTDTCRNNCTLTATYTHVPGSQCFTAGTLTNLEETLCHNSPNNALRIVYDGDNFYYKAAEKGKTDPITHRTIGENVIINAIPRYLLKSGYTTQKQITLANMSRSRKLIMTAGDGAAGDSTFDTDSNSDIILSAMTATGSLPVLPAPFPLAPVATRDSAHWSQGTFEIGFPGNSVVLAKSTITVALGEGTCKNRLISNVPSPLDGSKTIPLALVLNELETCTGRVNFAAPYVAPSIGCINGLLQGGSAEPCGTNDVSAATFAGSANDYDYLRWISTSAYNLSPNVDWDPASLVEPNVWRATRGIIGGTDGAEPLVALRVTGPPLANAGECVAVVVTVLDGFGEAGGVAADTSVTLALVSGSGTAHVNSDCTGSGTVTFSQGTSEQTLYVRLSASSTLEADDGAGGLAAGQWTITVGLVSDTTPPDTLIELSPPNPSGSSSATFVFSATEAANFECQIDGAAYGPCTSPSALTGLGSGSHTFAVRAMDLAGNTDPTPAAFTWTIDTVAPDTGVTDTGVPLPDLGFPCIYCTGSVCATPAEDGPCFISCSTKIPPKKCIWSKPTCTCF